MLEDQGFRFSISSTTPSYFIARSPFGHSYQFHRTNVHSNIFVLGAQQSNFDLPIISAATSKSPANAELSQSQVHPSPVSKTLSEWHSDLGHINCASIIAPSKIAGSNISIKGSKAPFFCDVCTQAGMIRLYSRVPMPRALRPLERVHVDIGGGGCTLDDAVDHPKASRRGTKYFLVITDYATRYRWIYFS